MHAGVVYCTLITARLAHQRLKVPWERLRAVPLNSAIMVRALASMQLAVCSSHQTSVVQGLLYSEAGQWLTHFVQGIEFSGFADSCRWRACG